MKIVNLLKKLLHDYIYLIVHVFDKTPLLSFPRERGYRGQKKMPKGEVSD